MSAGGAVFQSKPKTEDDAATRAIIAKLADIADRAKAGCDAEQRPYPPQLRSLIEWLEREPDH